MLNEIMSFIKNGNNITDLKGLQNHIKKTDRNYSIDEIITTLDYMFDGSVGDGRRKKKQNISKTNF